jgi:CDP-diacylglycerol--glycerol-3-phosphate 3-phosphatidyltransferase
MENYKNLPNYLTIGRILFIPIIISTFYFEQSYLARIIGGLLFATASITDFFDGYIARKYNLMSPFGAMLDPIADKVLVGCVLVMLVKTNRADAVPCLLILAREFVVSGLREFLAQIKISVPVSNLAKVKTAIQMIAINVLIVGNEGLRLSFIDIDLLGNLSLWIAAFLTLITAYSYLKASKQYF